MNQLEQGLLKPNELAAIKKADDIAKSLLGTVIEKKIIIDYILGMTHREIAWKYISHMCEISEIVAINSIGNLIRTSSMLNNKQRRELQHKHYSDSAKKMRDLGIGIYGRSGEERRRDSLIGYKSGIGKLTKEEIIEYGILGRKKMKRLGKGIFGLTKEQLSKICKKSGKIGGERSRDLKVGVHGRSKTKMKKDSRKAVMARGCIPWDDLPDREDFVEGKDEANMPEIAYAYNLSSNHEYRRGSLIRCQKIADKSNEIYHNGENVRGYRDMGFHLSEFRKQLNKDNSPNNKIGVKI